MRTTPVPGRVWAAGTARIACTAPLAASFFALLPGTASSRSANRQRHLRPQTEQTTPRSASHCRACSRKERLLAEQQTPWSLLACGLRPSAVRDGRNLAIPRSVDRFQALPGEQRGFLHSSKGDNHCPPLLKTSDDPVTAVGKPRSTPVSPSAFRSISPQCQSICELVPLCPSLY